MLAQYLRRQTRPERYAKLADPLMLWGRSLLSALGMPEYMADAPFQGVGVPQDATGAYRQLIHPQGSPADLEAYLRAMLGPQSHRPGSAPVAAPQDTPHLRAMLAQLLGRNQPLASFVPGGPADAGNRAAQAQMQGSFPTADLPGSNYLDAPPGFQGVQVQPGAGLDLHGLMSLLRQARQTGDLHALTMAHHHVMNSMQKHPNLHEEALQMALGPSLHSAIRANLGRRLGDAGILGQGSVYEGG